MHRTAILVLAALYLLAAPGVFPQDELQPAGTSAEQAGSPDDPDLVGWVITKGKRVPVLGARVVLEGTGRTEYAFEEGRFEFENVPPGDYKLVVSASGHETTEFPMTIEPGPDTEVRLYLPTGGVKLEEIVVIESKDTPNVADQTLDKEEIESVPGAANDPVKAVTNLPGVAATNALFTAGGLVIRGTSQEESGYYLNGQGMPYLFHFGALTYVYNSEFVKEVNYLPGGYGVRYGGALGGIVEVTSRRPRTDRFGGIVDLNSYASSILLEAPIGDKWGIAGAFRKSFIDYIIPEVIPEEQAEFTVAPSFWDYQFLVDYKPNASNRIELTAQGANDEVGLVDNEREPGEDPVTADRIGASFMFHRQDLAWIWEPSAATKNELSVSSLYLTTDLVLGLDQYVKNQFYTPRVREEFVTQLADWNRLTAGLELMPAWAQFELTVISPPKEGDPGPPSFSGDTILTADEDLWFTVGALYLQDEMDLGPYVRLTPGVRFEVVDYNWTYFFDPRLFLRITPVDRLAIKIGLGQYHQFPSSDELEENFGNPDLTPENSYQANLGIEYLFEYGISIDVQGFYKYLDNLVARNPDATDFDTPYKNKGIGFVYGGELLVRKKLTDWWLGWISYSYTVSRRKDNDDADWRWFDQDQRHNLTILASFQLPRGFKIGARWRYATGTPFTAIDGAIYNADTDQYVPVYSDEVNEERNPDFHQLDIRFDKLFTFNRWELAVYLDIQNVYLHPQPFGYTYNYDYTEREMITYPAVLPALGISARF